MQIKRILKYALHDLSLLLLNKFSKPIIVVLEITDRCNLDCPFCFNVRRKEDKEISRALDYGCIKDIIDRVSEFGVKRIKFTGGEPLLRDDIYDIMRYAKLKGLEVWLNTNATLVDKKKIAELSMLVDNVLVPINAFNVLTESFATKKYLFKQKLRGIELLKKSGIKIVRVGTVLTKFNISNFEKIYELVKKLEIKSWQLFRPIPKVADLFPINTDDVTILVEKLLAINGNTNQNYRIFNAIPFCAYEPEKMEKVAVGGKYDDGHNRLIIDSQGKVRPMYYMERNIGDVLITKDFKRFWNNKFMRDMRNLKFVPAICNKCRYLNICLGGSRAISKMVYKSYTHLDYLAQPLKYKKQLFS